MKFFEERTWPVCKETFNGQVEVFNLDNKDKTELQRYLGISAGENR
jgi:hypothetical protein